MLFIVLLSIVVIVVRVLNMEIDSAVWGVVKTRNAGISRNMAEYHGIYRNITEYGGISRNITIFSRNIPEHHSIFRL